MLLCDANSYDPSSELAPPVLPLLLHLATHAIWVGITAKLGLPVVVFDPTQAEQLAFDLLADFSASACGQCIIVSEVSILHGLDFFPPAFAPGLPHVRPEAHLVLEVKCA